MLDFGLLLLKILCYNSQHKSKKKSKAVKTNKNTQINKDSTPKDSTLPRAYLRHIIIQAGGKGTRLEGLTKNKPKCLVPYDNLPLIFHLFRAFPHSHFSIIADYKIEVLEKYLRIFAKNTSYHIIKPLAKGTISGIKQTIATFGDKESFMIIWCDLVLSQDFTLPSDNCHISTTLATPPHFNKIA